MICMLQRKLKQSRGSRDYERTPPTPAYKEGLTANRHLKESGGATLMSRGWQANSRCQRL